jgi:hypothetical protein
MRKNPWLGLLAGAATIVVVAGNLACEPTLVDEPKLLGDYAPLGLEWVSQTFTYDGW